MAAPAQAICIAMQQNLLECWSWSRRAQQSIWLQPIRGRYRHHTTGLEPAVLAQGQGRQLALTAESSGLPGCRLGGDKVSKTRTIKKYPNRRLYDTEQSRYITLADLQKLVVGGETFVVKDANSGNDITRNILLQIIAEQESGGEPLFTTDILMRIIRFYGDSVQSALTSYLEQSLKLFEQQQHHFQKQIRGAIGTNPVTAISDMTQRNLQIWQDIQNRFFETATGAVTKGGPDNQNEPE